VYTTVAIGALMLFSLVYQRHRSVFNGLSAIV